MRGSRREALPRSSSQKDTCTPAALQSSFCKLMRPKSAAFQKMLGFANSVHSKEELAKFQIYDVEFIFDFIPKCILYVHT